MNDIYPEALVVKGIIRRGGRVERWIKRAFSRTMTRIFAVVFISPHHMRFVKADVDLPRNVRIIPVSAHSDPFVHHAPEWVDPPFEATYCGTMGLMHETSTFVRWLERYGGSEKLAFSFHTSGAAKKNFERSVMDILRSRKPASKLALGNSLSEADWTESMMRAQVGLVFQDVGSGSVIFPSKMTSILAAGQAVLAVAELDSDVGRLIVDNDCGWVVEPGDIEGLERCISELVRPEILYRKRRNAFLLGHAEFGKFAVAGKWMELLALTGESCVP